MMQDFIHPQSLQMIIKLHLRLHNKYLTEVRGSGNAIIRAKHGRTGMSFNLTANSGTNCKSAEIGNG